MELKEYLKDKVRADFAEAIGVSQAFISYLLQGSRHPSTALARRIEQATGGVVSIEELLAHRVPDGYELRRKEKP